jgi:hypothetical protein
MCWVWSLPKEYLKWGADMDYGATFPLSESDCCSAVPLALGANRPVYRSNVGLKRFRQQHCPPIGICATVDRTWQDIILKFVPQSRIQFFPVMLIARGEVTEEFSWVLSFDRVECIDVKRSQITERIEHKDGGFSIMEMKKFYHLPTCLNGLHLARDVHLENHLLVSNELKDALSATGESSTFLKPEQMEHHYSSERWLQT